MTVAVPMPPNDVPEIVATPAETPVARPVAEIDTTAGLLLVQVAVAFGKVLPVESVAVAVNCCVRPMPSVAVDGETTTEEGPSVMTVWTVRFVVPR